MGQVNFIRDLIGEKLIYKLNLDLIKKNAISED